jgi:hypothetical protein
MTDVLVACAAFFTFVAVAKLESAPPPKPRIVIDCGTLRGAGSVAVEIPGTRYVTPFNCPQSDPQKDIST